MPTRRAADPAELQAIVDSLSVEVSARYLPANGKTFCNVYAYDYCYLASAYLPRVFWKGKALGDIARGEKPEAVYGKTVRELSANALHDWLEQWGDDYGWRRSFSPTEVQDAANAGRVGLVCARRREPGRSGHITCVIPEGFGLAAARSGRDVTELVQSQAGAKNKRRFVNRWWIERAHDYSSWGFWIHE